MPEFGTLRYHADMHESIINTITPHGESISKKSSVQAVPVHGLAIMRNLQFLD